MHAGTILWNGLDLTGLGKPKLGITRQADPPAPSAPTRQLLTLKVTVDLEAHDPSTIQARVAFLQTSMQVPDGILRSATGTGHALQWLATPVSDNLAEVLAGTRNRMEMTFASVVNHSTDAVNAITEASFTPAGQTDPIVLHAIRDNKEEIRTDRHSGRSAARKITTTTISFTARIAQANPADPAATRLAYLQAQAELVKALDCREGRLVFGATDRIVRVSQLDPAIDAGRGVLDLQVQCYYLVLPDDEQAEMDYDIRTRIEAGTGEEVLTFSGTIDALTREIALAKLEAIRATESTDGRRTTSFETADKRISGKDTGGIDGADWTGTLNFTLEMRSPRAGSHYQLKISTSRDIRSGMRWNYSGSVTAASEGAALTIARAIATAAAHPVQVKSEESIERVTDIYIPPTGAQANPHFVKLDFTYEFEGPSDGFFGGEITTDRNLPLFGEYRRVISGFLVATTRAAAELRLNILLAGELAAIEKTLKWSETYLDSTGVDPTPKRVFQKLEFSAASREARINASVKYTESTSNDLGNMLQRRTIAGSLWSNTRANADTALDNLITLLFGTGASAPTQIERNHHQERWGNSTQVTTANTNSAWSQLDFQCSKTSKLTGVIGYDIIEATFTLDREGSLNNTVITPIPFGRPVAQKDTGYLPGTVTLTANCKARLSNTARAWVQGKMTMVNGIGVAGSTRHMTQQPRESCSPEYEPFSGTNTTTFRFSGSYKWTFTNNALDGLWTAGFGGI